MRRVKEAVIWLGLMGPWLLLSGEVMELDALVVEGHHFDELALALPMGAKRIERSELESSGVRNVPEALERLAGIRIIDTTGNGATGEVAMRGFGENSGLRVLIVVDGQVYNPPDMGGINWSGLDIGQLETVEILRGGQTVLYGNHAVSGVIKLTTRKPGDKAERAGLASAGSDGHYRVKAWSSGRLGKLGVRAGISWQELGGFREHAALDTQNVYLGWDRAVGQTADWSGQLSLSRYAMELPGPLTFEDMRQDPRTSVSAQDEVEGETVQVTQFGEGTTDWGGWEVASGFLQRMRGWNLDGRTADNDLARATLNPRVKIHARDGYWITGLDLAYDVVDHRGYLDGEREVVLSNAELDRITTGGYLFRSYDLNGSLNLSGGVRIESASTDHRNAHYRENQLLPELETNRGTLVNPDYKNPPDLDPTRSYTGQVDKSGWAGEMSLLWTLSPRISIWGGWDRVYRYPALDETAAYQGYPLSDPLNENLDPETGNNFELGIKHAGRNWQSGLTGFYLQLNREISFVEYTDPDGGGLVRLNANVGDSVRKGVEANLAYRGERHGWDLSVSFIEATLVAGEGALRAPLVPRVETSATIWIKPCRTVRLQLYARYLSDQVQGNDFNNQYRRIPDYFLAHLSIFWDIGENFDLVAGLNNLFDKTYATAAYGGGFYPGTGRQAHVTLKIGF